MKTTLVLDDQLVRQAKQRAARLGMTLSAFAERSMRDALRERLAADSEPFQVPTFGRGLPVHDSAPGELKALLDDDE